MFFDSLAGIEVNRILKPASNINIAAAVNGNTTASIIIIPTPGASPLEIAFRVDLVQKNISKTIGCMFINTHAGIEIRCRTIIACSINAAVPIEGDSMARVDGFPAPCSRPAAAYGKRDDIIKRGISRIRRGGLDGCLILTRGGSGQVGDFHHPGVVVELFQGGDILAGDFWNGYRDGVYILLPVQDVDREIEF